MFTKFSQISLSFSEPSKKFNSLAILTDITQDLHKNAIFMLPIQSSEKFKNQFSSSFPTIFHTFPQSLLHHHRIKIIGVSFITPAANIM